jgi:hypothetical protein
MCGVGRLTSAKAMAPLRPANHITTCILYGMGTFLPRFATHARGKILKTLAKRQNPVQRKVKKIFIWVYFPVNRPMPMYKKTKYSLSTARDLNMLCAVILEVGERLWEL